jgi:hypothetical protein
MFIIMIYKMKIIYIDYITQMRAVKPNLRDYVWLLVISDLSSIERRQIG